MHPRAGQKAQQEDLVDVDALLDSYYDLHPDPADPDQAVSFGTSGHRGSSLDVAFNEDHIAATTQAIAEKGTVRVARTARRRRNSSSGCIARSR